MATVEAPIRLQVRLHEGPFKNEPSVDFTREENQRRMHSAIEKVRSQLGREYDLIIDGRRIKTAEKIRSLNPARPSEVVGIHQKAGREHVEPAMQAALKAFESWSRTSLEERASRIRRKHEATVHRTAARKNGGKSTSASFAVAGKLPHSATPARSVA